LLCKKNGKMIFLFWLYYKFLYVFQFKWFLKEYIYFFLKIFFIKLKFDLKENNEKTILLIINEQKN
jgi:hypothetical protein